MQLKLIYSMMWGRKVDSYLTVLDQISTFNLDLKDYGCCMEFNGGCSLNYECLSTFLATLPI